MISFASPVFTEPATPSKVRQESVPSARSRRFAIIPPPPSPKPDSQPSPPVPTRSPLRPTPRNTDNPAPTPAPAPEATRSKRKHALIELLSSERAYASDLALIRDIHVPLALGQPAPFPTSPPTSPSQPSSPLGPPMTKEDTRIIFGNVEELAVFSEVFCDKLEDALRGVLDPDGNGEDRVGELFLSMIPHLKPPYTTYITRHPAAVAHLNALPQTPALTAYLAQTHTLAQSYTHAWDLPSLLIKPVQRLLKYPLLLSAIIDDSEPGEARDKMREAREKVEEVARGVNEGRRRWEVVKGVLEGKHPPPVRIKSIKGLKIRAGSKDDEDQLELLEKRLHACETFVHEFAKDVVDWTMSVRDAVAQLERWSATFGRVIGLGHAHGSEALDLFTDIVASQITPVWISLDAAIQSTLLPKLARLLATTAQPLLLLSHMHALHPQHLQLLDAPLSKARPPASLLEASQSYLALNAQLRAELPRYITLLERGFTACLGQFADWQARFWKEVRAQWVELWDALGVEGDMNAGAAETVKVWWERWEEIDAAAHRLGITQLRRDRTSVQSAHATSPAAALATAFVAGPPPSVSLASPSLSSSSSASHRRHSIQSIELDLDMHVLASIRAGEFVPSPDSYSYSPTSSRSSRRDTSSSRRDSERREVVRWDGARPSTARPENDRPSTARPNDDRTSTPRRESDRPSTARRGSSRPPTTRLDIDDPGKPGIMKRTSVDSAGSSPWALSSSHPYAQASPRVSVHSTSSASASGSSNHRLSVHSIDLGLDMHVPQRPANTRGPVSRPYGSTPVASISDLVAAAWMPVLPGTAGSSESSSSSSSKKAKLPPEIDSPESRGRVMKKPSIRQRVTDAFRSPSKRPPARTSAQSMSTPELPRPLPQQPTTILYPEMPMYSCTVVHPFALTALTVYHGLPFLIFSVGDTLDVLAEEGHPRDHAALPIRPEDDNCEDCLLIARDKRGTVGWALASFLVVLS